MLSRMHELIHLDAYFARIGYDGPRAADLDTLYSLHALHPQAIPFENLDSLLGRSVALDFASLHRKLVLGGRGGYCFEHNHLLGEVLRALGFSVTGLAGRVCWNLPENAPPPRTHMVLLVNLDPPYIADVGFGGLTFTAPLRLEAGIIQETRHEPMRILRSGDGFLVQVLLAEQWQSLYRFDLQPQLPVDYEMANWYVSSHPASRFRKELIAARADIGCRYSLRNSELTIHRLRGKTERLRLRSGVEIRQRLESLFRLSLPEEESFDTVLERLTSDV
ncbi:arylamine N-acetyltransferase family protein [Methylacidimicrobium tartarophylax]|uniref:Arylamine N-acetyltransferase n=1 Tax=Methylacidimicrobium tartarophylax TaxID=1041768 RepID=A0A5E6MCI3_9BACT|nr:arylamine N-acetyltransferase [Methylacidimicrobium tartarophylax]VVM06640.1 arylamine N-acetyltransferase [Methylacidimicrobium tartarophylax]